MFVTFPWEYNFFWLNNTNNVFFSFWDQLKDDLYHTMEFGVPKNLGKCLPCLWVKTALLINPFDDWLFQVNDPVVTII